jgi:hypothetical protein
MLVELYGWLLHLLPPQYRSAFGREMTAVFRQAQADARDRGTISHTVFGIREFTGLIRASVRERARDSRQWAWHSESSQAPAGTSSTGSTFDGLPVFYSCDNYFPCWSALILGGILSVGLFNAVTAAYENDVGGPMRLRLGGSQGSECRYVTTNESGLLAFGRSLLSSTDGVETVVRGRQPTASPSELKRTVGKLEALRSNLWLLGLRPHFPRWNREVEPRGVARDSSALHAQKSGLPAVDIIGSLMLEFEKADIVGLGEHHWTRIDSDLRIRLIQNPDFPKKVHYIVVECGNALYQGILDRYISGDGIQKEELQRVWRDTTQPGAWDSPIYEQFLNEVRSVNRRLPKELKIRVLAGDPPIDWAKVKTPEDFEPIINTRDSFPAELIGQKILRHHEKALLIYGDGHFFRKALQVGSGALVPVSLHPTLASLLDESFPGRLYSIIAFGGPSPESTTLEHLIQGAERPVLLPLKGTAAGALDANDFLWPLVPVERNGQRLPIFPRGLRLAEAVDACLYYGDTDGTLVVPDPSIDADKIYAAEKDRRRGLFPRPKR